VVPCANSWCGRHTVWSGDWSADVWTSDQVPTVAAWATKVAGLSTSLMVSVPEVEISAARLVSVRLAVSAERTAASLVPRMLMVRSEGGRVGKAGGEGGGAVGSAAKSLGGG